MRFLKSIAVLIGLTAILAVVSPTAGAQGWDPSAEDQNRSKLVRRSNDAIEAFRTADPSLQIFFDRAYGYAVFPSIKKGALGIGGARGKGVVYRQGTPAYKTYVSQFTLGIQIGGKTYREILFFRDQDAYNAYIDGEFEISAQAGAVIASDGAGETASYSSGVAIFILDKTGALVEASVGGQTFSVKPL